ncbi:MAG TPA: Ig-like domain-containing protein, partial [Actinotalea sp.]|nr:Ig-like domain-containing protein [Actinotalea sp.]
MATSGTRGHGQRLRARLAVGLTLLLAGAGAVTASSAAADGPTTFSNVAAITVPAAGSAIPYPSSLTVSGLTGTVTAVTVTLHNLTHGSLEDVDAMVVAPTGANLVVLSDAGVPGPGAFATNATFTFSDSATSSIHPGNNPSGSYRPTNNGGGDAFPAPAPAPSAQTTLAGAFNGLNPNGTWQLFIVDDAAGDAGSLAGGWSLTVTTAVAAAASTTTLTSSANPSTVGQSVTFTATVTSGGTPVTAGTVQLSDGATPLGTVSLNAAGTATLTTSALSVGTHPITATFSGTATV